MYRALPRNSLFFASALNLIFMHKGEIIIYQTDSGETSIDVKLDHETVWLNQAPNATPFRPNEAKY